MEKPWHQVWERLELRCPQSCDVVAMLLFLQVIVCVGLVVIVGTKLSQSADVLAEKTRLGCNWVVCMSSIGASSLQGLLDLLVQILLIF